MKTARKKMINLDAVEEVVAELNETGLEKEIDDFLRKTMKTNRQSSVKKERSLPIELKIIE